MYLYSLTLQRATAINHAVYGNFSGPKQHEIMVARGKTLELLRPDENGKVQSVVACEVFGLIRSIQPFRLTGGQKDYLAIGSESGKITIVEYDVKKNDFVVLHQETFGKTGCRRIVPGEYLAVEPKGRAVMIGAVEKQKLVYILNRDSANRLTISSPLEAHRSHTIVFQVCAMDCGFDNPIFACLELDYGEADQDHTGEAAANAEKVLTYYELDLGLNHVVRQDTTAVPMTANYLIRVPGGADGPGGVIVCSEGVMTYMNQNHEDVTQTMPRRCDLDPQRGLIIVASATHKQKDMFFFLVQSEYGDIYKVTLDYSEQTVSGVNIQYFDTVPTANALVVLRNGFLFVASEFGNHILYQFQNIGSADDQIKGPTPEGGDPKLTYFQTRPLKNLVVIDDVDSLSPVLDAKVADYAREESPQIYALCGRGSKSSLRVLRHGLAVMQMAVSELPGNPKAVWTVKTHRQDPNDRYIVVSFINATLVLSIGDTVEEVQDSGFLAETPTLSVSLMGDDSLLQIHPNGTRFIRADKRVNEWKASNQQHIVHSAVNSQQVVLALSGGELVYFELDVSGQLSQVQTIELTAEITALAIQDVPEGRQRARFLSVATSDNSVRLFSLDNADLLQQLALQALPGAASSLCIAQMSSDVNDESNNTYLNVGLENGILLRTTVDPVNGALSDTRSRFLGTRPVKLFKLTIAETPAVLALSSRSWIGYSLRNRYHMTPLSYEQLEWASSFQSEQCPEGIVAVTGNTLRIISVEKLGEVFNQATIPLRHTPRRFAALPETNHLVIVETDHAAYPEEEAKKRKAEAGGPNGAEVDMKEGGEDDEEDEVDHALLVPKAPSGCWASCVRLFDPVQNETLQILDLPEGEGAFSVAVVDFHDREETFVLVGTAKDLNLYGAGGSASGFVHTYVLTNGKLEHVHATPVDEVPLAMRAFQGRVLIGVGKVLRIYDMGKRKLLRKCENKNFPLRIQSIHVQGDRVIVGDVGESFLYCKYKHAENQISVFADDTSPRWLTASAQLDYDTMAGADKFGNVFIARLPSEVSDDVETDPTGSGMGVGGAPHKVAEIIQFHVGETIHSLQRTSLVPAGPEALIYTTLMGSVGALLPFTSREDVDFFSHLEMHLRQEKPPLCGRDHLAFRSFYFPVKDVLDGDLCEQFSVLPLDVQKRIAEELDRTPGEVLKKLEDIRHRIL